MKKLLSLIILLALLGAGYTMWQHSQDTGRQPWQWTNADWNDWVTMTKHQGEQLSNQAKEQGEATWQWVGENTPALFDKSKELLARLGYETAAMPAGQASAPSADTTPAPQAPTIAADQPADPLDARSTNFKYGKEWLAKGIAEWQVSLVHPGAAQRAKDNFEKAISSFETAKAELGADADAEVAQLEQSARDYLADTDERLQQIRQSGQ